MADKAILNLDPKYLPELGEQISDLENVIKFHQKKLVEAQINIVSARRTLPFQSLTKKVQIQNTNMVVSERKSVEQQIEWTEKEVQERVAILDLLLPELDRLKALQAEVDAKAQAEAEAAEAEEAESEA